jgi:cytochrome c peroxidase
MRIYLILSILVFSASILLSFTLVEQSISTTKYEFIIPKGFPTPDIPADNNLTIQRIALGKKLFYDKMLSSDSSVSCGTCHAPKSAFADQRVLSEGVKGTKGDRNSMPLINLAWSNSFMWDGGVTSIELQIVNPLTNRKEMNIKLEEAVARLNAQPVYIKLFKKAYGTKPDAATLFKAIASFERTLVSARSKYDKYYYGKDPSVFNESEVRGFLLFNSEKTHCSSCHTGFNFTNGTFQNNGLYLEYKDQGRYNVTHLESDKGKFKVPTLRNIAITAPYMHDGSFKTLEEVIDHYNKGGVNHPNKSSHVHNNDSPPLTEEEKIDLINFLNTLTDETYLSNPAFLP